jgi:DNA-binding CsgD family transcriptional regulator
MCATNPICCPTDTHRVDSTFVNDTFVDVLDARLRRHNTRIWNHLLAWAEILDALGWCVALNTVSEPPYLGPTARQNLNLTLHSTPSWEDVERHLRDNPPVSHPVNDRGIHVWACLAPRLTAPVPTIPLTARETEVLHWLCEGKAGPEIAIILDCATRTIESHVARLYRKMGFHNRSHVLLNASRHG